MSATSVNNEGKALTNDSNIAASPFDFGAGEMSPVRALNPGLVYDTTTADYVTFLCYLGYKQSDIDSMAGRGSSNGSLSKCPAESRPDLVSNINYPTIAIANLTATSSVSRTVTNVGSNSDAVYAVNVISPTGLDVTVLPNKLVFSPTSTKLTFHVAFTATQATAKGYAFGSVIWEDGSHTVRTPFAVNVL